ncbi:MAG: phosphatase PAP2 family protein, partial [Calditrichales bacterium]
MKIPSKIWITCIFLGFISTSEVAAQTTDLVKSAALQTPEPFTLDQKQDILLLSSGIILSTAGWFLNQSADPLTPVQIEHLDQNNVNPFDRPAIRPFRTSFNGDYLIVVSALFPLVLLQTDHALQDWKTIAMMGSEVVLMQLGLNQMAKYFAPRIRPFVYDPDSPMSEKTENRARQSFYSGHTSTSAALTFFVATVYDRYTTNATMRSLVWAGAVIIPAITGYLRIDSGNHFYSDVLIGYATG